MRRQVYATSRDTDRIEREFDRRAATHDDSLNCWRAEIAAGLLEPEPGQLILDIATGTGLAASAAAQLAGPRTTVVGIDVSRGMLDFAVRQSDPVHCRYVRGDAHRLPFRPGVFDGVLCVAAIPYLRDLPQAVAEWRRVTRRDAPMVFTTTAADGITETQLLRQAAAAHRVHLPGPHAAPLGTAAGVEALAARVGLKIIHIKQHRCPALLDDHPRNSFTKIIDHGFADSVRDASHQTRQDIFVTYRAAYLRARFAGDASHNVLFTLCELS